MLINEKGNKHAKCKLLVKLNTVYWKRLRKKGAVLGASYYLKLLLSRFFFFLIIFWLHQILVAAHGLSSRGSLTLEHGLSSCGTWV